MIFVQDLLSFRQLSDLFRFLFPRHAQKPVDISARNGAFGRHRRHRFQPVQFLQGLFFGLFGHAGFFNLFLQLVEFGALIFAAQLFVNRLDLLVEVILFLRLFHLALDPRLDRAIELPLLEFDLQNFDQARQARLRRKQFQQSLLVFDRNAELRCEGVGHVRRIGVAHRRLQCVRLNFGRQPQMLFDQLGDLLHQRVGSRAFFLYDRRAAHQRSESAVVIFNAHGSGALAAFDDNFYLSVFLSLRLQNPGDRADAVNLFGRRLVNCRIVLGRQKNRAIGGQRQLQRAHRTRSANLERHLGKRKDHDVANRHHGVTSDVGWGTV